MTETEREFKLAKKEEENKKKKEQEAMEAARKANAEKIKKNSPSEKKPAPKLEKKAVEQPAVKPVAGEPDEKKSTEKTEAKEINYPKSAAGMPSDVPEQYHPKPEEPKPEDKIDEIASSIDTTIPEEVKQSDEIVHATDSIKEGNYFGLTQIKLPDGTDTYKMDFDPNGKAIPVPYEKADVENPALKSRGAAAFFTVMSVLLSAFTGGMVPPINFGKLLGTEDYWNKLNEQNAKVADLINGDIKEASTAEIGRTERGKDIEQAVENKDNLAAYGRMKEAESGSTAMQQAELNADLQKALQDNQLNMNLKVLNLTNEQQKEMAKLLYDQDVKQVINEVQAMKDKGYKTDEIAKYISSKQGVTSVGRFMGYVGQGANAIGNLLKLFGDPPSDKNVKKFDAKPSNNSLLRKHKLWR